MYLSGFIVFTLTIANFILAREIESRLELDDSDIRVDENINEAVTNVLVDTVPSQISECMLSRNSIEDIPNERVESEGTQRRMGIGNMEDSMEVPMMLKEEKPEIRNNVMFGPNIMSTRHPFFDGLDKLRQIDNHDDVESTISRIIDPISQPQSQLVDNTIRLMAIKASVDDLTDKLFPNLRMIQHAFETHRK